MKFVYVYCLLIHIFKVPFIVSEPPRWMVGHSYPRPLPQDIMVDAVNYIGLIILNAHNTNNENNIAFSPYGATSVLVALGEGVQGVALDEILRATLLPLDISITRVGLRDIHRHLKSYFIPQEGFLAGLTFSHENVTLKSSYEDILSFYGYDVNSFNNALYPEPNTPTATTAGTTTQSTPAITLEDKNTFSASTPTTTLTTTESVSTINTVVPETITATDSTVTATLIPSTTTAETTPTTAETASTGTSQEISTTTQPTTTAAATSTTQQSITTLTDGTVIITSTSSTTLDQGPTTTTEIITTDTPQDATQESSPAAITIDVVPSTLTTADTTSITSTTTTSTTIQNTGPVIIDVEPNTLSAANTDSTTGGTTTSTFQTETTNVDSTISTSILTTNTDTTPRDTTITIDLIPSTRSSQNGASTTTTNEDASTTNSDSTISASTLTTNTDTTTQDTAITIDITPSTRSSQNGETTTTTNEDVSTTNVDSTISASTLTTNTDTTTQDTAITIDLTPSTRSSQNGETITTTNEDVSVIPVPTLITPLGGDLPTGFEIQFQPTTLFPQNDEIRSNKSSESNKNAVTNKPTKRKPLPRFRDDVELVNSLKSENISAPIQSNSVKNRTIISANTKVTSINKQTEQLQSSFMFNTTDSLNEPKSITTEINDLHSSMTMKEFTAKTELVDVNGENVTTQSVVKQSIDVMPSHNDSIAARATLKSRGTRSVIDYLIARYHDNNPTHSYMTSATGYEPEKPITFAVNGKIREPNINFMTYDTVLPFRYISHLNALALTFPLDSTRYYLLLVLPIDETGINNLVSKMLGTTLKQIIYSLQPTRVKATIPSFMLKGYVVLTPTLQKLGIRQIFEPRRADFSRMTNDKDIYVTNIEQAVTVTIRNYLDPNTLQNDSHHYRRRGPVQFTADHPFLYFVMDSQIHVALMAGKIVNPLNSRIR